jgi:hypothetical protein
VAVLVAAEARNQPQHAQRLDGAASAVPMSAVSPNEALTTGMRPPYQLGRALPTLEPLARTTGSWQFSPLRLPATSDRLGSTAVDFTVESEWPGRVEAV